MTLSSNKKLKISDTLLYIICGEKTFTDNSNIIINIYDLHIILDQTKDQSTIYHKINIHKFINLIRYKDKVRFICGLNNNELTIKYLVYTSNYKKLSLFFKKSLIKLFKEFGIGIKLLDNKILLKFYDGNSEIPLNQKENTFFAIQF